MAFALPFSQLSIDDKNLIRKECTVKKYSEGRWNSVTCFLRSKVTQNVYLPLAKWSEFYKDFPNDFKNFSKTKTRFRGTLLTGKTDARGRDQDVVIQEAKMCLSKYHSCFLWLFTGYGKTQCGIYLSVWAQMKTVVLVFNSIIREQWKERFKSFTNANIQYLNSSKEKLDPKADVYLIGVKMAAKMDRSSFTDIGTVIIDEAHLSTESAFCQTLLKFEPKYLIGATATPRRKDNLHKIFELYFGSLNSFIFREERDKGHTVIKYCTKYRPEIGYITYHGKTGLNWNKIKNSLAYNPERQQEITNIIKKHPDEKIIVLTDRQQEARDLQRLVGDEAALMIGRKKKYDKTKRVLIAGMKKSGVGFDDPDLTMLILATSASDVKQFEGRLRRKNCIIYDIVDDHIALENHWRRRKTFYRKRGAIIKEQNGLIASNRGSSQRFLKKNKA